MSFVIIDRIAGRYFHPGPFQKGDKLLGTLEPENKNDPHAIKLTNFETQRHVGYLQKKLAKHISVDEIQSITVINALADLLCITLKPPINSEAQIELKRRIHSGTDTILIEPVLTLDTREDLIRDERKPNSCEDLTSSTTPSTTLTDEKVSVKRQRIE